MFVLFLFAARLLVYGPFRRLLLARRVSLLFFPLFANGYMVHFIEFIYFSCYSVPLLSELMLEILLLHIRMQLLDLLDPLYDLRLEKLFLNGADHLDPFTNIS